MNKKTLKITLNILIFLLIAGFGYYMIHSIMSEENTVQSSEGNTRDAFISPYEKINSFDFASDVICFDVFDDEIYAILEDKIEISNGFGWLSNFSNVRDIVINSGVDGRVMYLLYPKEIRVHYLDIKREFHKWEACSDNSDYCSFTTTKDYIFVTDAENKNIVQYDKQGNLVRFIKSPEGFIIPSYAFDIISINDTIYCANSGRHQIESYTPDGEFIASFGKSGAGAGAFAGCCNPVYLAKSSNGHILTSEKGNPRISCYGRNGKFRTILFDANTLGGGTKAYEMQVSDEYIYVSNNKTISVYGSRDAMHCVSTGKSCDGCKKDCPLRKGVNH